MQSITNMCYLDNSAATTTNNNTHICKAPYGRSFKGAGDRLRVTAGLPKETSVKISIKG